jgi:hypothetical protein
MNSAGEKTSGNLTEGHGEDNDRGMKMKSRRRYAT